MQSVFTVILSPEIFLIIINVENSCAAYNFKYFIYLNNLGYILNNILKCDTFYQGSMMNRKFKWTVFI